jgi:hypothetical protein
MLVFRSQMAPNWFFGPSVAAIQWLGYDRDVFVVRHVNRLEGPRSRPSGFFKVKSLETCINE